MKSHGALLSISKCYMSSGRTKITEFQSAKLYLNEIISKMICELRVENCFQSLERVIWIQRWEKDKHSVAAYSES